MVGPVSENILRAGKLAQFACPFLWRRFVQGVGVAGRAPFLTMRRRTLICFLYFTHLYTHMHRIMTIELSHNRLTNAFIPSISPPVNEWSGQWCPCPHEQHSAPDEDMHTAHGAGKKERFNVQAYPG